MKITGKTLGFIPDDNGKGFACSFADDGDTIVWMIVRSTHDMKGQMTAILADPPIDVSIELS